LPSDTPKYLSTDFDDKIDLLKRETNYLIGKAQRFIPKIKTTTTTTTTTTVKTPIDDETTNAETTDDSTTTTTTTTTNSIFEEDKETENKASASDEGK
jgi:hypothetical protein